jgi:hypothetical protein
MNRSVRPYHSAHVFTLRLWQEEVSNGAGEWRLQLCSVETGQTYYFRDWPALISLLLVMVPPDTSEHPSGAADPDDPARSG